MKAPTRLLEDPNTPAHVREHLARVRTSPTSFDPNAQLSRLQPRLASHARRLLALKVGGAVGVVGALALGAHLARSTPSASSPVPRPTLAVATASAPTPEMIEAGPPAIDITDLPLASATRAEPPKIEAADLLREEMEHLVDLRSLAKSDPSKAAAFADEGTRRFGRGTLYPEREAIAILALSQSGQAQEAQLRAKAFLAAYPHGPLAERVRNVFLKEATDPGQ